LDSTEIVILLHRISDTNAITLIFTLNNIQCIHFQSEL
jgi:hypothetical protein